MLILFHYISILIFEILQKRKRQKKLENVESVVSKISTCTESSTSKLRDSNIQFTNSKSSICNDLNVDPVDNKMSSFINSNVESIDGKNFTFNDLNVEFEYNKTTFNDSPKESLINRDSDIKIIKDMEELKLQEINIDEDLDNSIKFDPPVFRQRYAEVYTTLINEKWRTKVTKLCDFGCAELGLFTFIKRLNRLTDILFVDIDENILKDNARKIQPLTIEYLKRREEPLTVNLCAGSVADPDYRILNTDVITAIELIEHLYPDVLDAFPYNIFSYVEPKLVIITTPNADFNILFSSDPKRFRHYDHKFEWTREQFEDWANNIVTRYPDYSVTFSGLGEGPIGSENLGYCSQMALFTRKDLMNEKYTLKEYSIYCICSNESQCKGLNSTFLACKCVCPCCSPKSSYGVCTYYSYSKQITHEDQVENTSGNIFYKAIETIEYPFERDNRTEEEKMMDEFRYRINLFGHPNSRFFVEDRDRAEIPLKDLLYGPDWASITETELANLLAKNDYRIEKCVIPETDELETCVIFVPLMDNLTSSSEHSDFEDTNSGYFQSVKESLSDWDDDDDDAQQDLKDANADSSNSKADGVPKTVESELITRTLDIHTYR